MIPGTFRRDIIDNRWSTIVVESGSGDRAARRAREVRPEPVY